MTAIKTYKIEMLLQGRLTQLPDSQKIFGALIYMYADYYSSQKAALLVSKIREEEMYVSLSNMMPLDYLPVPQSYLLDQAARLPKQNNAGDLLRAKQIYQAIKKRVYVKKEQLEDFIANPEHATNVFPYVHIRSGQQIHASIDSVRLNIPGLDPNLYSVPEVTVLVKESETGKDKHVTAFSFYLCLDDSLESAELLDALHHAHSENRRFFLGARASQGLNQYMITAIRADEWAVKDGLRTFLNMGMLLPKNINYEQSFIQLYTSERRPYEAFGKWDNNEFQREFISFIEAGSIVSVKNSWQQAGRSISSPFRDRDVVFGHACLFPLDIEGRSSLGITQNV
ncbi:hypothetical protein [Paenibacillus arenosi]|uniref:Uncharacterized protein n=1 Tax=Paenibacillus arenosi TaxID=2774142 RepID=A0ABR9B0X8_9BACL|nr:hypothetical protein [Paenibacillus arenosi]MBD8499549.1 hypothetical protein [Paenibacillus arenosi]